MAIEASEQEKTMLVVLGVDESMRLAQPKPVTRVHREVKKRKPESCEDGDENRSSIRLNKKWKSVTEEQEVQPPMEDSQTSHSTLKVGRFQF